MNYPLNTAWSIWEHREGALTYGGNMHQLCTFNTLEEFWGYWNNIPKPSEMFGDSNVKRKFVNRTVSSFSIFKDGIRPEWEDPENENGGEWSIRKRLFPESLNQVWDNLILGLIGEDIDPVNEITGARIVHRTRKGQDFIRLELWLRTRDRDLADQIRDRLLKTLESGKHGVKLTVKDCDYKEHRATH